MLHINEQEAKKLLQRLQDEQKKIREKAAQEEYEVKQRQQTILSYLEPQIEKMDKFENEMSDPKKHLPKEKFHKKAKFSFVMCNDKYDKATRDPLPAVVNDLMNTK